MSADAADPTAELKQKTTQATAEAEFAKAETERLKAEKALADARKAVDPIIEASKAEKERLEGQKAAVDAKKALLDSTKSADQAAAQAAIGTVAASGIAGDLTLKPDAGKGEATLLAARAICKAAAAVAAEINDKAAGKCIVIRQGFEQFVNYRQFVLQRTLLERVFAAANREAARLQADADRAVGQTRPAGADALPAAAPILTTAGVALDALAKLGSYLLSNVEVGTIALSPDGDQLVAAVTEELLKKNLDVVLPNRRLPSTDELGATLKVVEDLVAQAGTAADRLADTAKTTADAAAKESDDTRKKALQAAAKTYEDAAAVLRKAITKAEEFIASLGTADAKGIVLLSKIVQEKAQYDLLLQKDTLVLSLDVRASVGSYYTRKNLWNFLSSSIPFFVMGGTVITFDLSDTAGKVVAAGLVPVHSGFVSVDRVGGYV
ncbi:exported protein of unknown function [Bradyrhizobium oligotrophicum S58]|uniref:Uncharacterized protein n=2 Tax=Bradyrhizobium oligotrophicum TaxID=44255 RepID=M4Z8M2_9BRAD|nr:exported protein of unknown function [Bradyrhizobium oligotrophicum S58]